MVGPRRRGGAAAGSTRGGIEGATIRARRRGGSEDTPGLWHNRLVRAWIAVAVVAVACKGDDRAAPAAKGFDPKACEAAIADRDASALDGGLAAVLAACTPCGVPWTPLVALSTTDPDAPAPPPLPGPDEVLAVLDACGATCRGSARTEVAELLRAAQAGRAPATAWRTIAKDCPGALRVDGRSERFARGTWYALDRIAAALGRDVDAEFPLPPYSAASTALAVPRAANVAPPPRRHVTIGETTVHGGLLPRVALRAAGPTVVGDDYPGAPLDDAALAALDEPVVLIAPRGLAAARVLEVAARLRHPPRLAATPREHGAPWPEPLGAIPVALARDATDGVMLPATATVADLAIALEAAAARGVAATSVAVAP